MRLDMIRDSLVADVDRHVRAELTTRRNSQDCVALFRGHSHGLLAVVVFSIADNAIARYDMCMP